MKKRKIKKMTDAELQKAGKGRSYTNVLCSVCGKTELKCDEKAENATCWKCTIYSACQFDPEYAESLLHPVKKVSALEKGFPQAWHLMKEFVHENGTVYHLGVEQSDLFGTLPATDIQEIIKNKKKSKEERKKIKELKEQKKEARLLKQYEKSQKIKKKQKAK